jgi:HEAT repeat protein
LAVGSPIRSKPESGIIDPDWGAMMRRVTILILALLLLSGPAFAQGRENAGIPIKRDRDKVKMGTPDREGPSGEEPAEEEEKKKEEEKSRDPVQVAIAALSGWPASAAREAATALTLQGRELEPVLLDALDKATPPQAAGICFVLGEIGGDRSLPALHAVASRPTMINHLGPVFTAIGKRAGVNAGQRILPFLRHPRRPARDAAEQWLKGHLTASEAPRLEELLTDASRGARLSALKLLVRIDPARARTRALSMLDDSSPEIAMLAAEVSVSEAGEERIGELNRLVTEGERRIPAYATISLVLHKDLTGRVAYTEEAITHLLSRDGLYSLDRFARGAAAVALADIGYSSARKDVDAVLDHDVVLTLLNTLAGSTFFPHYSSVAELSRNRFGLLTGQFERRSIPEFWEWWKEHKEGFVARRALHSLDPASVTTFRIRARSLGEPPLAHTLFSNVAEDAGQPENLAVRFIHLTDADVRALAALASERLLEMPDAGPVDAARVTGPGDFSPEVFAMVSADKRSRTVAGARDAAPSGLTDVIRALCDLRESYAWQTYWDRDTYSRFEDFIRIEAEFFGGEPSAEAVAERMRELILSSLDDLVTSGARETGAQRLLDLEVELSDSDAYRLARFVELERELTPFAESAIAVLTASRRALVVPMIAEWFAKNPSPRTMELLETMLTTLGPEEVRKAATAENEFLRRAAVRASVGRLEGNDLMTVLLAGIQDESPRVRADALRAVGRTDAEWSLDVLQSAMADPDPQVANAAVEGIGHLKRPGVVTVLVTELRSESEGRRMAAVKALCMTGHDDAVDPVLIALTLDPSPLVRGVAAREVPRFGIRALAGLTKVVTDSNADSEARIQAIDTMVKIGGDHIAMVLEALLSDRSDAVADAAAVALAARGRKGAVPRLLDALEKGRNPVRTLAALERISCRSFPTAKTSELPAIYRGWWGENRDGSELVWFAKALVRLGYSEAPLASLVGGRLSEEAGPVLIDALADEAWYIRVNANLYLQRILMTDCGDVTRFSTPEEVAAVQADWRRFWETR